MACMRAILCFLLAAAWAAAAPADFAGHWQLHLIRSGQEVSPARVELKVDGEKVTGTLNELSLVGSTQGDTIKLTATRPNGNQFGVLEGRLAGKELKGTVRTNDETIDWIMRRFPVSTA